MDSSKRARIVIQHDNLKIGNKTCGAVYFHLPEEPHGFLSNWYPSRFTLDGVQFTCAEQYIMYRKCLTFGDTESAEKILGTTDPAQHQAIAQQATGYNNTVWNGLRQVILMRALTAKFTQDEELRGALMCTGEDYLVECAHKDKIWACGEGLNDEERRDIDQWSGKNILGFALMEVRNMLRMEERSSESDKGPRGTIAVQVDDITTLAVDAIVNAANRSLLGGGGVDGAIHRAAGPQLVKECATLGGCNTGEAKITLGYKLPAKWVIHTVGPVYRGKETDAELLSHCYSNSLDLARENDIHSIAFPAISTGIYGYPLKEATAIAVSTVERWLDDHKEYAIDVIFCCFSQEAYDGYLECMAKTGGWAESADAE